MLYVDSMTKNPSLAVPSRRFSLDSLQAADQTSPSSEEWIGGSMNSSETPPAMTLSDFMGWNPIQCGGELKKTNSTGDLEDLRDKDEKALTKSPRSGTPKKNFYLDKLEYLNAIRSPIGRH